MWAAPGAVCRGPTLEPPVAAAVCMAAKAASCRSLKGAPYGRPRPSAHAGQRRGGQPAHGSRGRPGAPATTAAPRWGAVPTGWRRSSGRGHGVRQWVLPRLLARHGARPWPRGPARQRQDVAFRVRPGYEREFLSKRMSSLGLKRFCWRAGRCRWRMLENSGGRGRRQGSCWGEVTAPGMVLGTEEWGARGWLHTTEMQPAGSSWEDMSPRGSRLTLPGSSSDRSELPRVRSRPSRTPSRPS